MSKFVLTAQLQLQAPNNVRQVRNQIQSQLQGVNVNINLQNANQAQRQLTQVNSQVSRLNNTGSQLGKTFGVALKRFTAFTVATRVVSLFTNSLARATEEAIDFQRELVKISQVTGKTTQQLAGLAQTITDLSTSLGTSSKELLATTRILAQAGIQAQDLEVALEALAKTTLAPTFEDITKTAEGAVAILAQFGEGTAQLERQLGAINAVAGQFAVESGDLISTIRRTGGVFKASGGDLEELIALFTSVRATTRESAESIATGLRTIFTRIQRPATIEYLKQFGVELTDLNGKFVGPFEAVRQLSAALAGLEEGDIRFVEIAEELGGFRQIGKVIPLLQQFEVAERARQAAIEGGESLTKDAATAQQSLAVQITKVKEEFLALVRSITETTTFQVLVKTSLDLASALISIADALKPLLPLLGTFATIKIAQGVGNFAKGLGAGVRGARGFATGGLVPGTGNRDTVPAMLTPGEFVIRKSSVGKIGTSNLAAMNSHGYAFGGTIQVKDPDKYAAFALDSASGADLAATANGVKLSGTANKFVNQVIGTRNVASVPTTKELSQYTEGLTKQQQIDKGIISKSSSKLKINPRAKYKPSQGLLDAFNQDVGKTRKKGQELEYNMRGPFPVYGIGSPQSVQTDLQREFATGATTAIEAGAKSIEPYLVDKLSIGGPLNFKNGDFDLEDVLEGARPTIEGYLLEAVIGAVGGLKTGGGKGEGIRADFDFPIVTGESKEKLKNLFDPNDDISKVSKADAKRQRKTAAEGDGALVNKIAKDLTKKDFNLLSPVKKASGGAAPSDTVPALLTPGEFVINSKAASSIGKANLDRMNKKGVAGFATGGAVGRVKRYQRGGGPDLFDGIPMAPAAGGAKFPFEPEKLKKFTEAVEESTDQMENQEKKSRNLTFALVAGASTLGQLVPQVEGATEGFGAVQNQIGPLVTQFAALGGVLSEVDLGGGIEKFLGGRGIKVGKNFAKNVNLAAGAIVGAVAATSAATSMIDAYTGVHIKAKEAIEEGNIAEAGRAAVASNNAKLANKTALGTAAAGAALGTALGSVVPGIGNVAGAIIGGLGGAAIGLATKFGLMGEAGEKFIQAVGDGIAQLTGGKTSDQIKQEAEATAAAQKYQKEYADNAKAASDILSDVSAGTKTIKEAFESGDLTANLRNARVAYQEQAEAVGAANKRVKEQEAVGSAINKGKDFLDRTGLSLSAGIVARGGLTVAGGINNRNLDKVKGVAGEEAKKLEQSQKEVNKEIRNLLPQFAQLGRSMFLSGSGLDDFRKSVEEATGMAFDEIDPKLQIELNKRFAANAQAVAENTAAMAASTLGLRGIQEAGSSLNVELDRITSIVDGNFNSLAHSASVLENGLTNASISNSDFQAAMSNLNGTLKEFGTSDQVIGSFNKKFNALRAASAGFQDALQAASAEAASTGTADIKGLIEKQLLNIPGLEDEGKKFIRDILGGLRLEGDDLKRFREGDTSVLLEKLEAAGEGAKEKLNAAIQPIIDAQNKITALTQKRIAAEETLVQAQLKAINLQEDAANLLSDFGGRKLKTSDRLEFARQRLSTEIRGGAGSSGGVQDRLNRLEQISSSTAFATSRTSGGILNAGSVTDRQFAQDQQTIQRGQKDLDSLIKFSKERVKLYKEELDIVKKKNEQEKSALEKLIGGDFEGFIKQQQQSAAASALRSGSSAIAGLFGSDAILGGLKQLESEGADTATLRTAGRLALGPFATQRNVGVLTGTDSESERLRGLIREEAGFLQSAAATQQEIGGSELAISNAALTAANNELATAQRNAAVASAKLEESMNKLRQTADEQAARAEQIQQQVDKDNTALENMQKAADAMKQAAENLSNQNIQVKLSPTDVNVNLNGGSFLNNLQDTLKKDLMAEVSKQIGNLRQTNDGSFAIG